MKIFLEKYCGKAASNNQSLSNTTNHHGEFLQLENNVDKVVESSTWGRVERFRACIYKLLQHVYWYPENNSCPISVKGNNKIV